MFFHIHKTFFIFGSSRYCFMGFVRGVELWYFLVYGSQIQFTYKSRPRHGGPRQSQSTADPNAAVVACVSCVGWVGFVGCVVCWLPWLCCSCQFSRLCWLCRVDCVGCVGCLGCGGRFIVSTPWLFSEYWWRQQLSFTQRFYWGLAVRRTSRSSGRAGTRCSVACVLYLLDFFDFCWGCLHALGSILAFHSSNFTSNRMH